MAVGDPLNTNPINQLIYSGAGLTDLATNGKNIATAINLIASILQNLFPRVFGTFTLSAANSTLVLQPSVTSASIIQWVPMNAAAATLEGSADNIYVSARSAGASFTVHTASGSAAVGTEEFAYWIMNAV